MTLLLVIWESTIMKSVMHAVSQQLNKIGATILLFFIVVYWYSVWAFFDDEVRGSYAFEDRMETGNLIDYFRVHIDYGFSNPPIWENSGPIPFPSSIYNFGYVLFINLIITAIISGIIIDLQKCEDTKRRWLQTTITYVSFATFQETSSKGKGSNSPNIR